MTIEIERDTMFPVFTTVERWSGMEPTDMSMSSVEQVEVRWRDILSILLLIPPESFPEEVFEYIGITVGHERWARLPDNVLYKRLGAFNHDGKRFDGWILINPTFRGWTFGQVTQPQYNRGGLT